MTPKEVSLIQESWDYVITNIDKAGELFYGKLFEMDPALKPLFKGDLSVQADKLMSMITFVVSKLDNIGEVVSDVQDLGVRHKYYEVEPRHYDTVGAALLWTLEAGLGDQWSDAHRQAWTDVYVVLSNTMKEAAANEA